MLKDIQPRMSLAAPTPLPTSHSSNASKGGEIDWASLIAMLVGGGIGLAKGKPLLGLAAGTAFASGAQQSQLNRMRREQEEKEVEAKRIKAEADKLEAETKKAEAAGKKVREDAEEKRKQSTFDTQTKESAERAFIEGRGLEPVGQSLEQRQLLLKKKQEYEQGEYTYDPDRGAHVPKKPGKAIPVEGLPPKRYKPEPPRTLSPSDWNRYLADLKEQQENSFDDDEKKVLQGEIDRARRTIQKMMSDSGGGVGTGKTITSAQQNALIQKLIGKGMDEARARQKVEADLKARGVTVI